MESSNPIFFDESEGQWYFWNETWSDRHGPYNTYAEASEALWQYVKNELGG